MFLSEEQVTEYRDAGYLVAPGLFDQGEVTILRDAYRRINAKQAFCGGGWSWYQDYIAWQIMDGLPTPDIVNGSGSNISPFQRRILIISYNAVGNSPPLRSDARPDYLVARDTTPLRTEPADPGED